MAKWTLLIILILLLPVASAVNYPLKGFVTDNANIIDSVYEAKITQLAQKIEKEDTVEIAVVTVNSLEGESIEMYAVKLFEKAGIGKKDKDNGLLILVAKQEREYRFEVGYGLEGTITDSMKVNIGERIIVPNFKNGEYGKGIYESMVVIQGLVKGNEEIRSQYSMGQNGIEGVIQNSIDEVISYIVAIVVIIVILFIIFVVIAGILNYQKQSSDPEWRKKHRYRERPMEFPAGGWNWGSGGGGHSGGGGGFGGGFGGGGFGGFGGGRSGGGGFGGKW